MNYKQLIIKKAKELYSLDSIMNTFELIIYLKSSSEFDYIPNIYELQRIILDLYHSNDISDKDKQIIKNVYYLGESYSTPIINDNNVKVDFSVMQNDDFAPQRKLSLMIEGLSRIRGGFNEDIGSFVKNELEVLANKNEEEVKVGFSLGIITGTNKIDKAYKKGKNVFDNYIELNNLYDRQNAEILSLIYNFENLRNNLKYLRDDLVERISEIQDHLPQDYQNIFDFSEIDFLDTSVFRKNIDVEFSKIEKECQEFISIHNENVSNNIANSLKGGLDTFGRGLKKVADKNKRLTKSDLKRQGATAGIQAGIDIISNIAEGRAIAGKKAAEINLEVEKMKEYFSNDKELYSRDLIRLLEIHGIIGFELIPIMRKMIFKFSEKMESGIWDTLTEIYSSSEVKELKAQKNKVIEKIRLIELKQKELSISLSDYNLRRSKLLTQLDLQKPDYDFCKKREPRTHIILTILSLGISHFVYKKVYKQWELSTNDIVLPYEENLWEKEQLDDLIIKAEKDKENLVSVYEELKKEKSTINKLLTSELNVNKDLIARLKSHAEEISELNKYSKIIIEKGLDSHLLTKTQLN